MQILYIYTVQDPSPKQRSQVFMLQARNMNEPQKNIILRERPHII